MILAACVAVLVVSGPDRLAPCAWVRVENDGAGTGFLIDVAHKRLVTCRHVVADRTQVDVFFPWRRDGQLVTGRQEYLGNRKGLRDRGLLVTGRVVKTSNELDLALVEVATLPPGVQAVRLAPLPPTGEVLHVVGNRLDLETLWNVTAGPVRTHGRLLEGYFWRGQKLAANAETIIAQLPIDEGDSGGPVFNTQGEVVGMATALRRQCPLAAVLVTASEIRRFAELPPTPDPPRSLPLADRLTRCTVWVRPTATDVALAGALLDANLVLTVGKGLWVGDRVGVAFPIPAGSGWISQRAAYRDPLTLHLRGQWRSGTVLARDADCDLALIRLDAPVAFMRPVKLATDRPSPGELVHSMNHPGGLEFAWVYAAGPVRQRGQVTLGHGDGAKAVSSVLCQLPAQIGSPGGPVLNARGELVGIVAAKEAPQMVAYAVAADAIAAWLDRVWLDRPPHTLAGWTARLTAGPRWFTAAVAEGLARRAEERRQAGLLADANQDAQAAIALDPGCVPARLCRVRLLLANDRPEVALQELDAAVEKGPFDRRILLLRAELAAGAKDWRKARGDLERLLAVAPADADARQQLVGVLLELGEDAKAAAAVGDTLRAEPNRLPAVAAELLRQADRLAAKYPDAPSVSAGWLLLALTAANRPEFTRTLEAAQRLQDDAQRLAVLRAGLLKIK
jgi:S1-C subfamily serine protease